MSFFKTFKMALAEVIGFEALAAAEKRAATFRELYLASLEREIELQEGIEDMKACYDRCVDEANELRQDLNASHNFAAAVLKSRNSAEEALREVAAMPESRHMGKNHRRAVTLAKAWVAAEAAPQPQPVNVKA